MLLSGARIYATLLLLCHTVEKARYVVGGRCVRLYARQRVMQVGVAVPRLELRHVQAHVVVERHLPEGSFRVSRSYALRSV
eukprot:SAG11_NODE_1093_length_5906_cov_10.683313_5_plen_81_part_00